MPELLHEIQAADMLGFHEMADFRRALRLAQIPDPSRKLAIGKKTVSVWSRRTLQEWIDNQHGKALPDRSIDDAIANFR